MIQRIPKRVAVNRFVVQAIGDTACWAVALYVAALLRYNLELPAVNLRRLALTIPVAAGFQILTGVALGLYRGRWRYGSFDEVAALVRTVVLTGALVLVVDLLTPKRLVPRSAPLGGAFVALVAMAGVRYAWRLTLERSRRPSEEDKVRVLIYGAGEAAVQVISAMLRDPKSPYFPVGLIDDDPTKRNLSILGVRVVGDRHRVPAKARDLRADSILLAVPSATSQLISDISAIADGVGLQLKVLPPVSELYGAGVGLADFREVRTEDLLGRHVIDIDLDSIAAYLTNRRVLVTGAGGSIGSELCRQVWQFGPERLIMLDRDENALHGVQLSIEGRALLDSPSIVLCDIRDQASVEAAFQTHRPHVVFHAAALKHLPMLERHPAEAVKTNVFGTLNVLEAAIMVGVDRFVNISTDKAVDPVSVLGRTKRICERVTAEVGQEIAGVFVSVRFGNVLGSSGSVLATFRYQIQMGGPLTVTSPDASRYFMTIPEAVQLVIQAAAIGRSGEALVLDMGQPVKIIEVAQRLAAQANRNIEIVFTGLRPGEKVHEALLGPGEIDHRPMHPLISHVKVPRLEPDRARALPTLGDSAEIIARLASLCDDAVPARRD